MKSTALLAVVLLAATGCDLFDKALEVQSPTNIPVGGLETPANALPLVNGAIADFECAAGAYAVMGGLITDELIDATQTADRFPYDRRSMVSSDRRYSVNDCIGLGVYTPLQTARFSALNALSLLQIWTDAQVPGRDSLIATLQGYEGYSLVLLGEGFCTMVVSTLDANRQVVYGGEIPRDSVFKLAAAAFTPAFSGAGGSDAANMARVGRARAYADLGQLTLAAADAQLVDAGYSQFVTTSSINTRRYNRVWQENSATSINTSLDTLYLNMNDPRVPYLNRNKNSVTGIPLYEQVKYPSSAAPIRLASRDEARLIIAEADLAAANFVSADTILTSFRKRAKRDSDTTTITSTDPNTVRAALIDQRRREFFLEGQHLGDAIRFSLPLNPPAGTSYTGGRGTYGSNVCLPLPDVEKQNNPNFP